MQRTPCDKISKDGAVPLLLTAPIPAMNRSIVYSLLLVFLALLAFSACAQSAKTAPPQSSAAPPPSPTQESDQEIEWLIDEEGQQYIITHYSKNAAYRKLADGRVRIFGGIEVDLVGEDEENLHIKLVRVEPSATPRPRFRTPPTAEELAAVELTYRTELATQDRLKLEPFDRGLPTRGHWRNGFDIVDFDRDGKLDLVHGPPRKGGDQLRVFLGDGKGSWKPFGTSTPPGLLDYGDVRVVDLNRDGNLDVAIAVHLRGVLALLGDGRGGFSAASEGLDFTVPVIGQTAPTFSSRRVETLDWNGDGLLDILALSEGPTPSFGAARGGALGAQSATGEMYAKRGPRIYLNRGNGSWTPVAPPENANRHFGDDLAVADFDGDGDSDFVTSANLMGRPDLLFRHEPTGDTPASAELPVRPKAYVNAIAAGDFNRDGRTDIVMTYTSFELGVARTGIDLLAAAADSQWERRPLVTRPGKVGFDGLAAGDVDGDGALDLVAVDRDGDFYLLLGDGRGDFALESAPEAQKARGRCRGYEVRIADLDGDGAGEILASFADEPVAIHDPERCTNHGGIAAWRGARNR